MNQATAKGILGAGPVTTAFSPSKRNTAGGMCSFRFHQRSSSSQLSIEVITIAAPAHEFASYAAKCVAHSVPLRGIGNEAVACYESRGNRQISEEVIGRVRNQVFIIHLKTSNGSIRPAIAREKARNAAELVAGNLF